MGERCCSSPVVAGAGLGGSTSGCRRARQADTTSATGFPLEQFRQRRPFDGCVTEITVRGLTGRSPTAYAECVFMRYLDRARSIVRGIHGISLPDPNRIDIGAVPDTATLLEAID